MTRKTKESNYNSGDTKLQRKVRCPTKSGGLLVDLLTVADIAR